jgi:mono/diheme cytochrome c family protein
MRVLVAFSGPLFAVALISAQGSVPSDGLYSAAQADRGRRVVENHCSSCHGDSLRGLEGPALVGSAFMLKWEQKDLETLYRRIRDTMPPGEVTSLTEDEKADALAYLLQQNGYPQGTAELNRDPEVRARTPLSPQAGSLVLRTGSLVRVTGCLSQGEGNAWILTSATAAASLGSQTVRLLNVFPNPSGHKGHTVEVSGLLVRDATGVSLNTLSLEMRAPNCEP